MIKDELVMNVTIRATNNKRNIEFQHDYIIPEVALKIWADESMQPGNRSEEIAYVVMKGIANAAQLYDVMLFESVHAKVHADEENIDE